MSEHHRGAWGTREEAVWWPGAQDQQNMHQQQLINQHHQQQQQHQQLVQQQVQIQQHHVVQQTPQGQQHNDIARSINSNAPGQQIFSYKMASSFQNPAGGVTVATTNAGAYDYRLNMAPAAANTGAAAPGTQWWYTTGQNVEQIQQHNQAHQQTNQQHPQTNQHQQANQHIQDQHQIQQNHQQNNQNNQHLQPIQTPTPAKRGKHADGKPRGRMTAYAFFVQTCREEHKKKHPEEQVVFAEFSRKCAERWKTMLDKEKKRFHEMAEKDKARYDSEMQNYVPPKGVVLGRGKKRKQIKDPNAPKRSLSAFFWFCNDERTKVKALNPEYGVGDIAKELGKKWSDVEPTVKSKYEAMAENDKKRYEREMQEYKARCKGLPVGQPVGIQQAVPNQLKEEEDDEEDD
ncbi:high mobility group protein DSP1 [Contarinia nasturtii]|uniref:high mobility group protein DSP1 n=1 Tax=Contarinia nasturtii TaxID=265458 RepID=UPI0012D47FCB|nr:high mobility group protein DSP1 [Contarinia nasturtii]XP_031628781.1 high mobility group protein DSP1 [Contarinia nasturtii]